MGENSQSQRLLLLLPRRRAPVFSATSSSPSLQRGSVENDGIAIITPARCPGLMVAALAAPTQREANAVTIKQSLWQLEASGLHAGADERDAEPALTPAPWEVLELAHRLPASDSKGIFQPS